MISQSFNNFLWITLNRLLEENKCFDQLYSLLMTSCISSSLFSVENFIISFISFVSVRVHVCTLSPNMNQINLFGFELDHSFLLNIRFAMHYLEQWHPFNECVCFFPSLKVSKNCCTILSRKTCQLKAQFMILMSWCFDLRCQILSQGNYLVGTSLAFAVTFMLIHSLHLYYFDNRVDIHFMYPTRSEWIVLLNYIAQIKFELFTMLSKIPCSKNVRLLQKRIEHFVNDLISLGHSFNFKKLQSDFESQSDWRPRTIYTFFFQK